MDLLVLADIDDLRWRGGKGSAEALLACGDVCDETILGAAEAYGCDRIFAVKGNHDRAAPFAEGIVDVSLRVETFRGVRFGGLEGSWRYKPRGHFLYDQAEASAALAGFPEVDVFVSHNSPRGVHDRDDGVHIGFKALRRYLRRARPRLMVHGHQHVDRETTLKGVLVVGVHGFRTLTLPF
jgi:Icc-related predicted phosphoesterase